MRPRDSTGAVGSDGRQSGEVARSARSSLLDRARSPRRGRQTQNAVIVLFSAPRNGDASLRGILHASPLTPICTLAAAQRRRSVPKDPAATPLGLWAVAADATRVKVTRTGVTCHDQDRISRRTRDARRRRRGPDRGLGPCRAQHRSTRPRLSIRLTHPATHQSTSSTRSCWDTAGGKARATRSTGGRGLASPVELGGAASGRLRVPFRPSIMRSGLLVVSHVRLREVGVLPSPSGGYRPVAVDTDVLLSLNA